MAVVTYDLIVALTGVGGMPRAGVRVSVEPVGAGPLVAGTPTQTVVARPQVRYTDAAGQAVFPLLPSADAGDYRARIYDRGVISEKVFAMPLNDVRLSELGAEAGGNLYWATDPQFAGAAVSVTAAVTVPDFSGLAVQYVGVAKVRPSVKWIGQAGTGYNQIGAWQQQADGTIGAEPVEVWQSVSPWIGAVVSGTAWEVR